MIVCGLLFSKKLEKNILEKYLKHRFPFIWLLYNYSSTFDQGVCPQWQDDRDILAALRVNNYNVESCIYNYTATSALVDLKMSKSSVSKSTLDDSYSLQQMESKMFYMKTKMTEYQNRLKHEVDEKDYFKKKNTELEEKCSTLQAEQHRLKTQLDSLHHSKTGHVPEKGAVSIKLDGLRNLSKLITALKKTHIQIRSEINTHKSLIMVSLNGGNLKVKSLVTLISNRGDQLEALRNLYRREAMQRKLLYNQLQELRGNIRVFCRIRQDPIAAKAKTQPLKVIEDDNIMTTYNHTTKHFQFDKVFDVSSTQVQIYEEVSPIITSCADGYNVTILAYGQTGSGKTYTMQGTSSEPGVNMRAIEELLKICSNRKNYNYQLMANMIEIYNENVQDLLSDKLETLEIRATGSHNVTVVGLTTLQVKTTADIVKIMNLGASNRKMAETKMNSSSSRSHLVLVLNVIGSDKMTGITIKGKLNLVDLAGSERVSKTEATGARLTEAAFINKSLATLGQVFAALRANQLHVPYRNSKLTHILEPSLGGDSKVCLIVNVSPIEDNAGESVSSLLFGSNSRQIALGHAKANVQKSTPLIATSSGAK